MSDRIIEKLQILADAAKYDVSCSSSGSNRQNKNKGVGNTGNGICHTYTGSYQNPVVSFYSLFG